MTRRVIPQKSIDYILGEFRNEYYENTFDYLDDKECIEHYYFVEYPEKLPYRIGEVVAVAQSYMDAGYDRDMIQRATFRTNAYGGKQIGDFKICLLPGWKNKRFVYPTMMPHQIRITNVRVEKLQDISDQDCLKEGIIEGDAEPKLYGFKNGKHYDSFFSPREAFATLIDKVSGKGTWQSNPWVFVYEFELVK